MFIAGNTIPSLIADFTALNFASRTNDSSSNFFQEEASLTLGTILLITEYATMGQLVAKVTADPLQKVSRITILAPIFCADQATGSTLLTRISRQIETSVAFQASSIITEDTRIFKQLTRITCA